MPRTGVLVVLVVNRKYFVNLSQAVTAGTIGAIAKVSPAFAVAVDALTSLPAIRWSARRSRSR